MFDGCIITRRIYIILPLEVPLSFLTVMNIAHADTTAYIWLTYNDLLKYIGFLITILVLQSSVDPVWWKIARV